MFKIILVPTDFSAASQKVVECLPGLKPIGVQEVVIVHVVDIRLAGGLAVSLQKSDEEILEQNKAELEQAGLKVRTQVLVGIPFVEIVRLANRESASMIMMAEKGATFAEEVLLGSVTESVIRHAKRPVLIQKFAPLEGKTKEEYALVCKNVFRRVLYATDFSDSAEKVIDYIKEMKDAGCDEITVLHVQDTRMLSHHPESRIEEFNQIDSERLARIKNELEQSGLKKVTARLDKGVPISKILEVADELDVCLIAMGAYGKSKVAEMLLGSVSENVVRRSTRSVLLVHAI